VDDELKKLKNELDDQAQGGAANLYLQETGYLNDVRQQQNLAEEELLEIAFTEFSRGRQAVAEAEESERQEAIRKRVALSMRAQAQAKKSTHIPKILVKTKPAPTLNDDDPDPARKRQKSLTSDKTDLDEEVKEEQEIPEGLALDYSDDDE
jgi:hypothetical protein